MIKKIEIQNFQSHKHTSLSLTEGVNVITGTSDSGKSTIIRALRWLIWNKPLGDAFRSHWGGKTQVTVQLDSKYQITRSKDKDNVYIITTPKGKQSIFKAIKGGVPEEVTNLLNINKINLQQQMDSPYLISQSPGEVAGHFNNIAKLNQIDESLKVIQSNTRRLNQEIQSQEAYQKELQEQYNQFNYLPSLEEDIKDLQKKEEKLSEYQQTQNNINEIILSLQEISNNISGEQVLIDINPLVEELDGLNQSRKALSKNHSVLQNIIDKINGIDIQMNSLQEKVKAERDITEIEDLQKELTPLQTQSDNLNKLIKELMSSEDKLLGEEQELNDIETTFHKEMPEVCPLCGNRIEN